MITRYGYDVVAVILALTLIGALLSWYMVEWKPLKFGLIAILLLLLVFTFNFFRDPERVTPAGDHLVVAPADGKIIEISDVMEDEYLKGEGTQVSIFMSPLDVHVNRYPLTGHVGYFRYIPGEYLVAYEEKSSTRNERTHIGVERGTTKILFKQIAGFVARRIVAEVKVGDETTAGQRFGMIRFGSRVDVILPKQTEVKVRVGDRTVGGETVLAVLI